MRLLLLALLLAACGAADPPHDGSVNTALDQAVGSMATEREANQDSRLEAIEHEQRLIRDELRRLRLRTPVPAEAASPDAWGDFRRERQINDRLETLERAEAARR